jgi:hypothetical protein
LARFPLNFVRLQQEKTESIFAYGRDPYFPGWPDTLQLNYGNPATQEAMINELIKISGQCDGVRCDMAMLVLPDIFERTWGIKSQAFWTEATRRVKELHAGFVFMAEVYWDLEWRLQQEGFDYTYDKRLYDRLHEGHAGPVRGHLHAGLDFQTRSARFLENHDEPRAASAFFPEMHKAAAVITFCTPGLRFFHQGQFEGRRKRISPHLVRAPEESIDANVKFFYTQLLDTLKQPAFRTGTWQLLECAPEWDGNRTNDSYIAFAWEGAEGERIVVAVNYSPLQSQCRLRIPFADIASSQWRFEDLFSHTIYDRSGNDLRDNGLFLDEPGWKYYAFTLTRTPWK